METIAFGLTFDYLPIAVTAAGLLLATLIPVWYIRAEASQLIDKSRNLMRDKKSLFEEATAKILLEQSILVVRHLASDRDDLHRYTDFWYRLRNQIPTLSYDGMLDALKAANLYEAVIGMMNLSEESKTRFLDVMFTRFEIESIKDEVEEIVNKTTRAFIVTPTLAAAFFIVGLVQIESTLLPLLFIGVGVLVYSVFQSGIYQLRFVSSLQQKIRKIEDTENFDMLYRAIFE
ncbi:MAG: hypothetical protein HYU39_11035 [Thaumarchaeota archaeon]|nr:hypothetical protein [Nitrososphaerota archaeon]